MRPVGSGGGGHGVCEETERLQTRLLALEGCVLFPVGLKESFLVLFPTPNESSFRTLTCLLAKAQEGNDAVLAPGLPG